MSTHSAQDVDAVVRLQNEQLEWGLSEAMIQAYTAAITGLTLTKKERTTLDQVVVNYHLFHALIRILQDKQHPRNEEEWVSIRQYVYAIIISRGLGWSRDVICSPDDLCQVVLVDVIDSIKRYTYRSALRTWLHSLTLQRVKRFHRDANAGKRSALRVSLDQAIEVPYTGRSAEECAEAKAMVEMLDQCLNDQRNKRLPAILALRYFQNSTAVEIGSVVKLHPSRVRALLAELRIFLSAHPRWIEWFGEHRRLTDETLPDSNANRADETDAEKED